MTNSDKVFTEAIGKCSVLIGALLGLAIVLVSSLI
jgi:hypothetical protein